MVAVPPFQHSPMFGQRASSHTVCSEELWMWRWREGKVVWLGEETRSQVGRGGWGEPTAGVRGV